jgi:long-chain acyl-CoA synthetase
MTLEQLCSSALSRPHDQAAIEFNGTWLSWGDLRRVAESCCAQLQECNIPRNSDIALIARNQPAAIAAFLGLISLGYNIRMIYPFQSSQCIATDLEQDPSAAVLAIDSDFSETVLHVLEKQDIAGIAFNDSGAQIAYHPVSRRNTSKTGTPTIAILSSGTTGKPKPIALSYTLVAKDIVGINAAPAPGGSQSVTPALLYFPLGNISGLYTTLPPLLHGIPVVLLDRFSLESWRQHIVRYRPTVNGLPPAAIKMLLDSNIPKADLASLRYIGAGAAPLDINVQTAFEQRYDVTILLSYGATEFGGPVTRMTPQLLEQYGNHKAGSVGRAMDGIELRIIDPESEELLSTGKVGLLEVKAQRMGEHWIRTGDLAKLDEDGFLYHQGRADGAIIRGGFKILPETIESALLQHPAIAASAVVGIADSRLGQVPVAAIVLKNNVDSLSDQELEEYLRDNVLATHIPVAWRRLTALPRTPLSYKVDQAAVRQLFIQDQ